MVISGAIIITLANAVIIQLLGLRGFYIRFYFFTLILPYLVLLSFFARTKGAKLLFGILTVEILGNVAIVNGLFFSYLISGKDNPVLDVIIRIITFSLILPIFLRYIRPKFLQILEKLDKGWTFLNAVLMVSYILSYYIAFVPSPIMYRADYFPHLYINILLSILIYVIIFLFFIQIQSKFETERDKQLLSIQVSALANQSVKISASEDKMRILRHDMHHHFNIISDHLSKGNIEDAQNFIGYCEDELRKSVIKQYCKNRTINAALSYYIELAIENCITIETSIEIPEIINLNSAELAVVFSNGFENAINACLSIEDKRKRRIVLKAKYTQKNLIINISNSCLNTVKFDKNSIPVATKQGHGIGIMSITAFANKNGGILDFSKTDDIFTFRLFLNIN
ncbi:MAG: GHKL domain-containing protein [Spirochaetales bacterium]|nr:GHKL domain-containing protein [Spirochaetales bacterium]